MIIDTKNKTVQLDDETIGQCVEALKAMVQDWAEYKFTPKTVTVTLKEYVPHREPYIIPSPVYPINPYYDFDHMRITCDINTCEGNIMYPTTKDSTGEPIYGALANTPIKHHRFSIS